jgi:hypothetical protein
VLGTFFFTLFPEIARVATSPWDLSLWDLGKIAAAVLLVFHFVFDYVYTSEILIYNVKIFLVDFLILVSLFVAYSAVNLGGESEMDITTTAGAMGITYLLFRLWARRVGGSVRDGRVLRNYEFGTAFCFIVAMIIAVFPTLRLSAFWFLLIGLLGAALAMWTIAPRILKTFKREHGVDSDG